MLTYQGNVITKHTDVNNWLKSTVLPPIPANTVRVRTSDGAIPIKGTGTYYSTTYETATRVADTTDIYDVYKSGTNLNYLLSMSTNVIEVLGANITNVTDIRGMFRSCSSLISVTLFDTSNVSDISEMFDYCTSLTSVPLFDTSNVTNMGYMLLRCNSLSVIPLFNTSKVTSMDGMCFECTNVQTGALALFEQAKNQTTPPSSHNQTFYNCGSNTETGRDELLRIWDSWK